MALHPALHPAVEELGKVQVRAGTIHAVIAGHYTGEIHVIAQDPHRSLVRDALARHHVPFEEKRAEAKSATVFVVRKAGPEGKTFFDAIAAYGLNPDAKFRVVRM